jgi:hypothetical protein
MPQAGDLAITAVDSGSISGAVGLSPRTGHR